MKKTFITILFASFSTLLSSQINEIGLFIGGSNYVGDVGRTNYIYPNNIAYGLIYKWNWNPRIALRGTLTRMPISGDDVDADNSGRTNRGFNFNNRIDEIALGVEFNFYEYDLSSDDKSWTPYILVEFAAFNYSIPTDITRNNPVEFTTANTTSFSIPFGIGIKSKFSDNLAIAFETRFRYTFVDDLDYTSDKFPALDFGGTSNDWYVFTGVSISYTFGRPACYTKGF